MNDNENAASLAERLKELIRRGGIARIQVLRGEQLVLNLPLNAGVAGAAVGLYAAPWTLAAAAAAALGFNCRIRLVKVGGETVTLEEGKDYTVEYRGNIDPGTGQAVITGKGNFTGSITKTFTILPPAAEVASRRRKLSPLTILT